jgi:hypothetical protein
MVSPAIESQANNYPGYLDTLPFHEYSSSDLRPINRAISRQRDQLT